MSHVFRDKILPVEIDVKTALPFYELHDVVA